MRYSVAVLALVVLLVIVGVWIALKPGPAAEPSPGTATTTVSFPQTLTTPSGITFGWQPDLYGLAVTPEQILTRSYIPPCDSGTPGFDYCLYRVGNQYEGTNFESAGLRIKQRTDLKTKNACLTTLPEGFTKMMPKAEVTDDYTTSVFSPVGSAGAGHYASGSLYRLSYGSTCYEFETRIGETQYANYPEGSIKKFTDADRANVQKELLQLLGSITIASSSEKVTFPAL